MKRSRGFVVDVYQGRECVGEREDRIAYWNFCKWTRLCKLLRQALFCMNMGVCII